MPINININVVMTCFAPVPERGEYALLTARSLLRNLNVSDCPYTATFRLILADDGYIGTGVPNYLPSGKIRQTCAHFGWSVYETFSSRHGIGASLNAALAGVGRDDLWFYCTDDWVLTRPLNLSVAVRLIMEHGYDYVRVNPLHPNLKCETKFNQDIGWWLKLYPSMGGFCFATRPFLAKRAFYHKVGPFIENTDAYVTEEDYAKRVAVYLPELLLGAVVDLHGNWHHIGEYEVGKIIPEGAGKGVGINA